jgi:hypothetical protein
MFVEKKADVIKVAHKYSPSRDFVMVLKKMGANNLFNISPPLAVSNSEAKVADNLDTEVFMLGNYGVSDWFGPHIVNVTGNADGDRKLSEFTGGTHNYESVESIPGTPTARTADLRLEADGKKVDDFSGYANKIDIYWNNYVQAANTKKVDGSGREVLIEHYRVSFSGQQWDVECDVEFLEDVRWARYYGLQCVYSACWEENIKFGAEDWVALGKDIQSKSKTCDTMLLRRGSHFLEMHIDNNVGIGNRSLKKSSSLPGAFAANYGKAYFYLVNDESGVVKGGTIHHYKGYYKFYYQ